MKSHGLLTLISPQNLLHCTLEVVITKRREYSAEISKRQLVCFEKSLLTGVRECAMEGSAAGHTPHLKQISLLPLSADLCVGFIPVHLCFCAPRIRLRNEGLSTGQALTSSSVRKRGDESWTPPRPLPASPLGSGTRCDVPYAVASVAPGGPLPESHRRKPSPVPASVALAPVSFVRSEPH
jgi:hypothetical protein